MSDLVRNPEDQFSRVAAHINKEVPISLHVLDQYIFGLQNDYFKISILSKSKLSSFYLTCRSMYNHNRLIQVKA